MKRLGCWLLILALLLGSAGTVSARGEEAPTETPVEILDLLAGRLVPLEETNRQVYNRMNNAQGNNKIVYDDTFLYFTWGTSLFCADYDGGNVLELTDVLQNNTSIACVDGMVYCSLGAGGSNYFASVNPDGSELPRRINSFRDFGGRLTGQEFENRSTGIWNITASADGQGKLYFAYTVTESDKWQSYSETAVGCYNPADDTVSKLNNGWRRTTKDASGTQNDIWVDESFALFDSPYHDGVWYKNLATGEEIVISTMSPKNMIVMGGKIYLIENGTNKLYRMSMVGSQKRKLADEVNHFVITDQSLLLYSTAEGLFAAGENAQHALLVTEDVTGRFYLLGDWVYYYTDTTIQRLNCHTGETQVVFDSALI